MSIFRARAARSAALALLLVVPLAAQAVCDPPPGGNLGGGTFRPSRPVQPDDLPGGCGGIRHPSTASGGVYASSYHHFDVLNPYLPSTEYWWNLNGNSDLAAAGSPIVLVWSFRQHIVESPFAWDARLQVRIVNDADSRPYALALEYLVHDELGERLVSSQQQAFAPRTPVSIYSLWDGRRGYMSLTINGTLSQFPMQVGVLPTGLDFGIVEVLTPKSGAAPAVYPDISVVYPGLDSDR